MAEYYTPDPEFYDKQIKAQEKLRKDLTGASYDSAKRAYIVNGKRYSGEQLQSAIDAIDGKIAAITKDKDTYGQYGPAYSDNAQNTPTGDQFMELYNAAKAIDVTDFDSALLSLKAWKAVDAFLATNKDVKVAVERSAIVRGERGRDVVGTITVLVDPLKDKTFRSDMETSSKSAKDTAYSQAEAGVVKSETVLKGRGAAATRSTKKTVTDQTTLDARLKQVDDVVSEPAAKTIERIKTEPVVPATTATTVAPATAGAGAKPKAGTTDKTMRPSGAGDFRKAEEATKFVAEKPKPSGGTGGKGGAGGKIPPAPEMKWDAVVAKFRELFPSQSWIVDIDPAKYPDVQKLIRRAADPKNALTPERFAEEWKNTSFYKELATTGKMREIKQLIGDAGFDTMPLNAFVTKAMNLSWSGDTLKFEAYKEAFRTNPDGTQVNPTAVERIKKSNDYLSVAKIGKDFYNQVSDKTVQSVLMGDMTNEDVQRQQRELAKTRYGHLSSLIDQGLSLSDIADNFRTQAGQLLEKDPNSIDMGSADYEVAFNYGEPGQKRVMTNGEWTRLLRSDAKYGWDKTTNAKQEAQKLSDNIVAAFGRVL